MSILVVDVGTSSVRAVLVRPDGSVDLARRRPLPPDVPAAGLVEFDPAAMAEAALDVAAEVAAAAGGGVDAVGVTAQRASAVAWDAKSGRPVGPGLGWQDLRTVGTCLELQAEGFRFSPSESATKYAWLASQLDDHDAHLKLGTVDSWIAWNLTGGAEHITDATNAAVTGLYDPASGGWRADALAALRLREESLPRIVDSTGALAVATALPGTPPLCSLVGDQQASLVGQGCTRRGLAKATFGTGGMLDVCLGSSPPASGRTPRGCFPIVAWRRAGTVTWGSEALMLTAGSAVDWLVSDLGLLPDAAASEAVAAGCDDTGGVVMVPALLGLGTPQWDFGARGAVFGLTRGTTSAHLVRAVLEGVAHSGADLLEAVEADNDLTVPTLRVDGGMSANAVFVQALADACDRPIEVSPELEATALGAGYLAGLATGAWASTEEIAEAWSPKRVVEPSGRDPGRQRWKAAVEHAGQWYPELSAISF
ncbi:MAG TPA: FGGY-family carbohydrate kinase [Acidimicrobiales bacterium]|nr:FGGY-family carbohydrate kinase [Acidimicrobiales bacterium]